MKRPFLFFGVVLGLFLYGLYSAWRLYWIFEIGFNRLAWHSVIWVYLNVFLLILMGIWLSFLIFKKQKEIILKAGALAIGLWTTICMLEIFVRLTKTEQDYSELRMGYFENPIKPSPERMKLWYWVHLPNTIKKLESGNEYVFYRKTNSLGLSDYEWKLKKDTNVFRIITLGDSFTEGDGAMYDSCYPSQLRAILPQIRNGKKIEVLNAGACGSDPYFQYKLLKDKLIGYAPDIVLFTNSHNDLYWDHALYGGFERFNADTTLKPTQQNEDWMKVYAVSHLFRLIRRVFFNLEGVLDYEVRQKNDLKTFIDARMLCGRFSKLAVANNFKCIQLLRPEKSEFKAGHFAWNIDSLVPLSLPNFSTFNLLTYYQDSLHISGKYYHQFYWEHDGHHNAQGYTVMAKGVKRAIMPLLPK